MARELILGIRDRAALFSNDKDSKSPIVKFMVADHEFSDTISFEKPMLIFVALKKKDKYDKSNKDYKVHKDLKEMG